MVVSVEIELSTSTLRRLDALARARGVTRSELLSRVLASEEFLEHLANAVIHESLPEAESEASSTTARAPKPEG